MGWRPAFRALASRQLSGTKPGARDLAGLGAEVARTAADLERPAAIVAHDGDRCRRRHLLSPDQGCWLRWLRRDLGPDEHDRRGGIRKRRGPGQGEESPGSDAPRCAGVGKQGPSGTGELTIFASGPGEARAPVLPCSTRSASARSGVGQVGAGTRLKIVNNTWLALRDGSGCHVGGSFSPASPGSRPGRWWTQLGGGPLVSTWQAAKLQRIRQRRLLGPVSVRLRSRTHLALEAAGEVRFASAPLLGRRMATGCRSGPRRPDVTVVTRALELQGETR